MGPMPGLGRSLSRMTRETPQTNRCKMQRPERSQADPITESPTINEPFVPLGSLFWVDAFSKVGREAPVRTEPLPTIRGSLVSSE
jgi:hypothetical protein